MYKNLKKHQDQFFSTTNKENIIEEVSYLVEKFDQYEIEDSVYLQIKDKKQDIDLEDFGKDREQVTSEMISFFENQRKWNHPNVCQNISPPVLSEAVAVSALTNLYNPNGIWDFNSPGSQKFENEIARYIARLVDWDENKVDGVMSFGGKGCLIYGIKMGIKRALPNVNIDGINQKLVILTSVNNHYIIENTASLLGIGSDNVIRIAVTLDGKIDFEAFKNEYLKQINLGNKIACIILSGGDTINLHIDSPKEIADYINQSFLDKLIDYIPWIHFDTVVSWAWLMFKDYDFKVNNLSLKDKSLAEIKVVYDRLIEAKYADSIGVDFHKIGFMHYQSSMFIAKDINEFRTINLDDNPNLGLNPIGENFMQYHMIEHTRSVAPIIATWYTLHRLGKNVFREYVAQMIDLKHETQLILKQNPRIIILNQNSLSFAVVYVIIPSKFELKEIDQYTSVEIEQINQFNLNFNHSLEKGYYLDQEFIFSFMPQYQVVNNYFISGIKIFYSSTLLTCKMVSEMIDNLLKILSLFEKDYNSGLYKNTETNLTFVPR